MSDVEETEMHAPVDNPADSNPIILTVPPPASPFPSTPGGLQVLHRLPSPSPDVEAVLVRDPRTRCEFVHKRPRTRWAHSMLAEACATSIYGVLGVKAPRMMLYDGRRPVVLCEIVAGTPYAVRCALAVTDAHALIDVVEAAAEIRKGFIADVLLGNVAMFDAAPPNVVMSNVDGRPYRTISGVALGYAAEHHARHEGLWSQQVWTAGEEAAIDALEQLRTGVFGDLTDAEIVCQIDQLLALEADILDCLPPLDRDWLAYRATVTRRFTILFALGEALRKQLIGHLSLEIYHLMHDCAPDGTELEAAVVVELIEVIVAQKETLIAAMKPAQRPILAKQLESLQSHLRALRAAAGG